MQNKRKNKSKPLMNSGCLFIKSHVIIHAYCILCAMEDRCKMLTCLIDLSVHGHCFYLTFEAFEKMSRARFYIMSLLMACNGRKKNILQNCRHKITKDKLIYNYV